MKTVFLNIERINYDNKMDLIYNSEYVYYDKTNKEDIIKHIGDASIVVTKELVVDKETIEAFPNSVKLICEAGTGYNNIDVEACTKKGIKVCNVPNYATNNVALFTIMLMLNMSTSMGKQIKMLDNDDYSNFGNTLKVNYNELSNKTLGIIGLGKIGQKLADLADSLGMNVITYTRSKKDDFRWIKYVSLDELLSTSDYISLNCFLSDETRHIINKDNINKIKHSAFVINTARGALIDEEALYNALKDNKIAGAGLDVLEKEPASKDNPLFKLDNVIITPHMAWNSIEARTRLLNTTYENIESFKNGNIINNVN